MGWQRRWRTDAPGQSLLALIGFPVTSQLQGQSLHNTKNNHNIITIIMIIEIIIITTTKIMITIITTVFVLSSS